MLELFLSSFLGKTNITYQIFPLHPFQSSKLICFIHWGFHTSHDYQGKKWFKHPPDFSPFCSCSASTTSPLQSIWFRDLILTITWLNQLLQHANNLPWLCITTDIKDCQLPAQIILATHVTTSRPAQICFKYLCSTATGYH